MASILVPNHNRRFRLLDRESCSLVYSIFIFKTLQNAIHLRRRAARSDNSRVVG